MDALKQLAVGLVVFVAVDFLWLGMIANGFYRKGLGSMLRMQGDDLAPRLLPAGLLYVMIVAGLIVFALPRVRGGSAIEATAWCALYGVIAYSVYDLTNYATLEGFPLRVAVIDILWGGVVCGLTGAALWMVRPV